MPPSHTFRQYRLEHGLPVLGVSAPIALSPNQVEIQIQAASLNYRDLLTLEDAKQHGLPPLSDCMGTISKVGIDVADWKVGDRVCANFFPTWIDGPFTPQAYSTALGGGGTPGVLAESLAVSADSLVAIPDYLSAEGAATLPCAALTAWHALIERGNLKAGETVLVQGTGGVALFGLQIAAALGAKTIVISSSDEKLARTKALGAWKTVNYKTDPDWEKTILATTNGRGVDHILELGGPETYDRSITAIAFGGRIHQIGVLTGFNHQPNTLPLQFKNASIHGICVGSVEMFKRMNTFFKLHRIQPVIDRFFSFERAKDAYSYLHSGQHFGKVVIAH